MAVYKPSNCIPFMDALDLTKPQDISCELNTSNMNIVGYKLKILDSQNTVIFEGSKFTPLNDKSIRSYNNTGVNGTVLTLPLIVTDENLMNENTILFKGVETADQDNSLYKSYDYKEDGENALPDKLSAINKSLYYRWYTRVTYDDVPREVYDKATANGGLYYLYATYVADENAEPYKKTYEQAVANEYYYCENYIEISPKPEFDVAWHRFYYIAEKTGLTLVNDKNAYESASRIYAREQLFDSKKKSSTSWNIAKLGQNNFYSLEQYHCEQKKGVFTEETYYILDEKGVPYLLKNTAEDKETFNNAKVVYVKITDINYNYDVVNDYLYYRPLLTQTDYNNFKGDIVYVPRYIFIGDIEPSVYYSSVLRVYNKKYNFVNAIESGAQVPNYISVVENGNYYVSPDFGKFKLITEIPFGYKVMMDDTGSSNRYLYTLRGNGGVKFDKSGKLISGFYENKEKEVITGFYNGAPNQPYKWQISLAQGEYDVTPDNLGSKWYDMTVTTGKVIGSTADRIQGLYSEEIYKDYYIQLHKVDPKTSEMVGNRVRISSYDHTFGYVYPVEGGFPEDVITKGINKSVPNYFSIYKWPNDPDVVAAARKVDYVTDDHSVDVDIRGIKIVDGSGFSSGSATDTYRKQVYNGKIVASDISPSLYAALSNGEPGAWALSATTLLIKDEKEADGQYSKYNGVYKMVSINYDETANKTTIQWQRTAEADTVADMLGRVFFISHGKMAGTNYENTLEAGDEINSSPIEFKVEEPIEIYPEPDNNNVGYYDDLHQNVEFRKHFSPIFKTTKDQIFIRPFVGVNAGMRFTYKNNAGYFNIEKMDNKIWCITPPEKKFDETTALKPGDDYTVTSYFKVSDENPFYGYSTPTIDLIIKNSTGSFDSSGAEIVSDRRLKVDAIYSQLQNITWKNYRWTLYNNTDGYVVSQTDTIYTGGFENEFAGLENDSYYTITLEVETEAGDYLSVSKQVLVKVSVVNKIGLQSAFDCGLQAIKFSFIREGIITPTPQISDSILYGEGNETDDKTQFMRITDKIEDRNYGVKYDSILLSSMIQEDLQGPTDNSITINSQHILGDYFEGDIMDVIVGISEQEGRKMRQRIAIDAGYDTENDNGYYTENSNRNRMFVKVYTEAYEGGGWNVKSKKDPIPVEFYNEDGKTPYIASDKYIWRKKKPVLLAYNADGTAKDDYDYLVISGPDPNKRNLRYLLPPTYEYNVFQYPLNEETYNGKSVLNPLTTSSTAGKMQAVWIDNEVTPMLQKDSNNKEIAGTYVGVLDLEQPTVWADTNSTNDVLHWQDKKDNSFQKQVYVNENQNHSGRQDFATRRFTFNITVDNLDPMISRNEMQISAKCFVKDDVWQKDAIVYIDDNKHKAKLNGDVLMIYPY